MATAVRVTRVHNPRRSYRRTKVNRRRRRTTNVRRSYRNRRRRMTPAQIRHFGTKRQRAALKARNRRKRAPAPNRRRRTYRKSAVRASNRRRYNRRRRSNLAAGFWREDPDDPGYQIWHPIRASYDYDPRRAHVSSGGKSESSLHRRWQGRKTSSSRRVHGRGITGKRRRKTANRSRKRSNKRRTRRNPTLIEFGTLNPRGGIVHRTYRKHKRRTNVARRRNRRRRSVVNYRRRRHNRRRRSAVVPTNGVVRRRHRRVYHRRRHHNPRRNYRGRRRNPAVFGQSSPKEVGFMVLGGLVGVAATKYLPSMLPVGITSGLGMGGGIVQVGISVAGAFVAGWVGGMWDRSFGDAVLFGGLMQAGSQLLSLVLNPNPLALSGLGDIVSTRGFVVPQNPVLQPIAAAAPSKGMGAFRGAFGYRR